MRIYKTIENEFILKFKIKHKLSDCSSKAKSDNQVDFIYEKETENIMVEVYATVGKALSAKKRKLVSDAFKMLSIENKKGKTFDKYIITVNEEHWKNSIKNTWQVDAIKKLGIKILYYGITVEQERELIEARNKNIKLQLKHKE